MRTTTITETTNISCYLDAVENGIQLSDSDSIKKLCEETSHASAGIKEVESHLDSEGQRDSRILRAALNELQVKFALGKMETTDKVEAMERRIEHGYSLVKQAVGRLERLSEDEMNVLRDRIHRSWIHLKAAGTIARIRLHLAEEKSETKLEAAMDELIEDFKKIRSLAKQSTSDACEKSAEWIDKTKKAVRTKTHHILDVLKR